MSQPEITK